MARGVPVVEARKLGFKHGPATPRDIERSFSTHKLSSTRKWHEFAGDYTGNRITVRRNWKRDKMAEQNDRYFVDTRISRVYLAYV